ncbi:MAG: hypothetical protein LBR12_00950 [Opitutaceae bacterium]|jgi:hypothetical protein|nr:hypothetical protein [Opitutaceae bacterium]
MKKSLIPFLCALSASVVNLLQADDNPPRNIAFPGEHPRHLQGIATDSSGNLFWSWTTRLVKTDPSGKILQSVDTPSHYGDLTVVGNRVHVAVNLGVFNEETGAESFVYTHDADTLALLSKTPVPELVHGAGGIAYADGRFYIIGGLPKTHKQNYVYEYTEDLKFVKRIVVESGWTLLGVQTICRGPDGEWWLGCYGKRQNGKSRPVALRCDKNFKFIARHDVDLAVGMAISPNPDFAWVAQNITSRKDDRKSHAATLRLIPYKTLLETKLAN